MIKIKLGDVLDVKRGASLAGEYYSEQGHYIRLTLGNFNYPNGGFKENKSKTDIYYVGDIREEFILKKGDIITPLTEQVSGLLGETATIPEDDLYIQCGDIGLVIPDEKRLTKRYAYYLMSSPLVKKQLDASAQQTKIRHTSPDSIKSCEAWIPEQLSEQEKIATFLDNINLAISNKNAICSELEAMAKLLYEYWFVQFDFPDENGKPYKSSGGKMVWNDELKREIPEGWLPQKLSDIAQYSEKKVDNAKLNENSYIGNDNLLPDMKGRKKSEYLPTEGYSTRYCKGDILVGNIRPYFKKIWLAQNEGGCSADVLCVQSKDIVPNEFIFCTLARDAFFIYDTAGVTGSKMPRGDKTHIMDYPFPFSANIAHAFSEKLKACFDITESIYEENQQLINLRNFLLPMLMNGQVKLNN